MASTGPMNWPKRVFSAPGDEANVVPGVEIELFQQRRQVVRDMAALALDYARPDQSRCVSCIL